MPDTSSPLPPTPIGESPSHGLSAEEQDHLSRALAAIRSALAASGGALPFDRYMELVLYAPGVGYYVSGTQKFGAAGDFVTAPELSPMFSYCLAAQAAEVLAVTGGDLLEFGAGSGVMAADVLAELERLQSLPERYLIIELSAELQHRQRQTLTERVPHLLSRVQWLEQLPEAGFRGVVLANEVLDAMPVQRFRWVDGRVQELFVTTPGPKTSALALEWRSVQTPGLKIAVDALRSELPFAIPDQGGYESELNLRLGPWLEALAERLDRAAVFLIDYGYTSRDYYHPERAMGTLICHFRQRAHADVLHLPGLQDITANVDFSAVARAAHTAGLAVAGYTTQANFLLGCGLDTLMARSDPQQVGEHMALLQGAKQLVLPSEMGERFKVIGLTRRIDQPLRGFALRDLSDRL